ncbi:hypothetical protein BJX61DRAFT_494477 [Aspergillus egyptiacus]|nr:hypothetical protein BJX61DRAFT_494477 [Aspergillus egyptiacus]
MQDEVFSDFSSTDPAQAHWVRFPCVRKSTAKVHWGNGDIFESQTCSDTPSSMTSAELEGVEGEMWPGDRCILGSDTVMVSIKMHPRCALSFPPSSMQGAPDSDTTMYLSTCI